MNKETFIKKYFKNETIDKIVDVFDNVTAVAAFLLLWMLLTIVNMYILFFIGFPDSTLYVNSLCIALIIVGYFLKNGNIQINSMY